MVTPGVSRGTRIMDCWRYLSGLSGSVLPMTIRIAQRGSPAPEDHHFRPLMTYSSPSRAMRHWMLVASEDATSGSVMQNAERISPSSSGVEPAALLLLRPVALERLHVAGVGRRAVEHLGRPVHPPHDLGERRVFEVGQPRRALRMREGQVPEPLLARARLELLDDRHRLPAIGHRRLLRIVHGLVRMDVPRHEILEPLLQHLHALGECEIHAPLLRSCRQG